MQNSDFGPTHKTGGAEHKINDSCFLKFFISMKFNPSQAQKMIFSQFQLCGISLDEGTYSTLLIYLGGTPLIYVLI